MSKRDVTSTCLRVQRRQGSYLCPHAHEPAATLRGRSVAGPVHHGWCSIVPTSSQRSPRFQEAGRASREKKKPRGQYTTTEPTQQKGRFLASHKTPSLGRDFTCMVSAYQTNRWCASTSNCELMVCPTVHQSEHTHRFLSTKSSSKSPGSGSTMALLFRRLLRAKP